MSALCALAAGAYGWLAVMSKQNAGLFFCPLLVVVVRMDDPEPLPIRLVRAGATEEIAIDDPPHVHQPLIQTIVDELNGVGHCPSTGESGARTAAVMERLLESVSFEAADDAGKTVAIDARYVDDHLGNLVKDEDLSRYIL